MTQEYSFTIYDKTSKLPEDWDNLSGQNIFLSTPYLIALENSAPHNMTCHFIGLYSARELIGIAISQFLDTKQLESFGERDRCLKKTLRNFIFRQFSSNVLFIGNNMLTGQNALSLAASVDAVKAYTALAKAAVELKKIFAGHGKKVQLITLKDFEKPQIVDFQKAGYSDFLEFSTQPNMIFDVQENWLTFEGYIDKLSKKYRDQYKRSRKKATTLIKRKMNLEDIITNEKTINSLYKHIALNAPFNTFFLAENHFRSMKENLHDNFVFYGYFLEGSLVGFNTLIKNGDNLDTYFLGYDENVQRENMLYLNMLYDMIAYAINNNFRKVIFARTALEIKSSVGAQPHKMYGLMQHSNSLINKNLDKIFAYLEPKTEWQQRHPFKETTLVDT